MLSIGNISERHWRPSGESLLGVLILASLIASSRLGSRLPMAVQDSALVLVVVMPFGLALVSWEILREAQKSKDGTKLRFWVSACGCIALSFAIAVPFIVIFFMLSWMTWSVVCLCASALSLLCGIFATRLMRFPLVFGGIVVGGLVFVVPVGVL
jgi:hypothetical protein